MRHTALATLLFLAACDGGNGGGGGGTPAPTPTPANVAPAFTSGTTASVVENTAAAYQATATDANGDPVTFAIAGGADAARFTITASGALSFSPAPNFDLPGDADGNNVYAVQLRVSDATLSSTLDLQVTVTNSREGIRVRRVATGFDQPVYVAPIAGSADVFVAEKTGRIWRLNTATGAKVQAHRFVNLSTDGERGLLGLALTPNFATSNIALAVATAANGDVEVRRFAMGTEDLVGLPGYSVQLSIPHAGASNHNGGWIGYGPDGHVYVAVGDGGGSGDPGNNAQNPASRLGKILRLANNPDPFAGATPRFFMPAPGNPYAAGGGDAYVYATGLRNPFRASFGTDGRLYIGDVGQGALEEIDVVRTDQPGLNFGWRFFEGLNTFTGTPPAGFLHTTPVAQYGRTAGGTVIGGYVYRGPITSLRGSYVFGDFISGNLWSVPATSLVQGTTLGAANFERRNTDLAPDAGTISSLVSFGEDDAGNLYIVDIGGSIFVIEPG